MRLVLDALLLLAALGILSRAIGEAREAAGGAGRRPGGARGDGFLAHRRRLREMQEKHRLDAEREQQRHGHRLTEQEERDNRARQREREREERQRERYDDDGAPPRRTVRSVIRLKPEKPDGEDPGAPQAPGGGTREPAPAPPGTAPPPGGNRPRPGPSPTKPSQPPPAPAPAPASEGTVTVTSPAIATTAVEDILLGIDRSADTGIAGNVHAKRRALAEIAAVLARCDSAITRMQRSMNEEGLYGPEITDPMTGPADQAASAARGLTEVDSVILSLLRTPAGELAGSGYQVPHHAELSETGGR